MRMCQLSSRGTVALICGMASAACSADTPEGPAVPAPSLSAEVVTLYKGWFPLNPPPGGIYNPCTGETIHFSGDYNLIVRMVTSESGHTQFRVHSQANVKGTAEGTGTEYIALDLFNLTQNAGPDGQAVFHIQYPLRSVSKGPLSNAKGWIMSHLTVNANGEVTASRDEVAFDVCQK